MDDNDKLRPFGFYLHGCIDGFNRKIINKNIERIRCPSFAFEFVSLKETIQEVNKLSIKKASQTLDIPVKKEESEELK